MHLQRLLVMHFRDYLWVVKEKGVKVRERKLRLKKDVKENVVKDNNDGGTYTVGQLGKLSSPLQSVCFPFIVSPSPSHFTVLIFPVPSLATFALPQHPLLILAV